MTQLSYGSERMGLEKELQDLLKKSEIRRLNGELKTSILQFFIYLAQGLMLNWIVWSYVYKEIMKF